MELYIIKNNLGDITYSSELTPPFWREYITKQLRQKGGVNSHNNLLALSCS